MRRLYPSQHSPLATEALHPKVPSWSTRRQIQQLHSDTQPRQVEDLPTMKQVSDKAQSGIGLKQLSQLAIYLSANLAMIQWLGQSVTEEQFVGQALRSAEKKYNQTNQRLTQPNRKYTHTSLKENCKWWHTLLNTGSKCRIKCLDASCLNVHYCCYKTRLHGILCAGTFGAPHAIAKLLPKDARGRFICWIQDFRRLANSGTREALFRSF